MSISNKHQQSSSPPTILSFASHVTTTCCLMPKIPQTKTYHYFMFMCQISHTYLIVNKNSTNENFTITSCPCAKYLILLLSPNLSVYIWDTTALRVRGDLSYLPYLFVGKIFHKPRLTFTRYCFLEIFITIFLASGGGRFEPNSYMWEDWPKLLNCKIHLIYRFLNTIKLQQVHKS